ALIGHAQAQTDATEQERHADQRDRAGRATGAGQLERAGARGRAGAGAGARRGGPRGRTSRARCAEVRRLAEAVVPLALAGGRARRGLLLRRRLGLRGAEGILVLLVAGPVAALGRSGRGDRAGGERGDSEQRDEAARGQHEARRVSRPPAVPRAGQALPSSGSMPSPRADTKPLHILVLTDRDWTHPQGGGTGA